MSARIYPFHQVAANCYATCQEGLLFPATFQQALEDFIIDRPAPLAWRKALQPPDRKVSAGDVLTSRGEHACPHHPVDFARGQ